jgi:hypothetical protein
VNICHMLRTSQTNMYLSLSLSLSVYINIYYEFYQSTLIRNGCTCVRAHKNSPMQNLNQKKRGYTCKECLHVRARTQESTHAKLETTKEREQPCDIGHALSYATTLDRLDP